jgi:hypothetical protein
MFVSLLAGVILGLLSWIITTVVMFQKFDLNSSGIGNIADFFKSINNHTNSLFFSGALIPMLVGNCLSIGVGGIVVVLLTLITTKPLNVDQTGEVWEKTRDIDSPLLPWTEIYAKYAMIFLDFNIITTNFDSTKIK